MKLTNHIHKNIILLTTYLTINIISFFSFFFYKIEFLLYPNLSVYVCEIPSWRLEP